MIKLSAIVIAKDEEKKIEACLQSVVWVDEIILVDTGSSDRTISIAKKYKAKVYEYKGGSYDSWRNEGLKRASGKWVLYLDADERVTPELQKEIEKVLVQPVSDAWYVIPRRNIILGREMKHGGWWPDYVKRLLKKRALKGWKGELHEEPVISSKGQSASGGEGSFGYLKQPLVHLKPDNLAEMVEKTNRWSEVEARLLFEAGHPEMSWWRFIRIMLSELWLRLVIKQGFLDGVEGVIYAFYQTWSRFMTYAKLWELQQA